MNNHKIYRLFCLCILISVLSGCIKNDLPYPRIAQNITSIAAVGESRDAFIDSLGLKVTLYLEETTDIQNVRFSEFTVTPGGEADINLLEGSYDLEQPLFVSIARYQTYIWEIKAVQNIERYFSIEGQVGESVIDPVACRVIVYIPETLDASNLHIERMKLGPEGITTYEPNLSNGLIDLVHPLRVEVTFHGRTEYWTIYAEKVEQLVGTDNVIAGSQVIWVYGSCPSDMKGGFQYRKASENSWSNLDASLVSQTDGSFSACIPHLEPFTDYVVRAVAGDDIGNEVAVKTDATMDLPDGSFDQWWLDNKTWCPWDEGGTPYWDTGNTGAATLGQSNVVPTEHTVTGYGKAAELNTKFIGLFGVGKLGAGSIYTGSFKKVDGTNGILDFGRPFTTRPTKLKGYYQYNAVDIDYANSEYSYLIGRPDTCHIYIALTDWTAPFEIRTNPNKRNLFNKDADYVIAYGELIYSGHMSNYESFEIELNYRNLFIRPTYIQITCAASKYGDFFTGGNGSVLYVDEFSLDYDY